MESGKSRPSTFVPEHGPVLRKSGRAVIGGWFRRAVRTGCGVLALGSGKNEIPYRSTTG